MQDAVCGQGVRFIESGRCWTDHLAWRSASSAFPLSLVPERVPDSLQLGQTSARPFLPGLFAIYCDHRSVSKSVYFPSSGLFCYHIPYFYTVEQHLELLRSKYTNAQLCGRLLFSASCRLPKIDAPSHFLWRFLAGLPSTNNKISRRPFCEVE